MIQSRKGVMKHPALRGRYQQAIAAARARRSQPGQDAARAVQGLNAQRGTQTHRTTQRPRFNIGQRHQQVRRNRSNEQGGLARPATPHSARFATPHRRY